MTAQLFAEFRNESDFSRYPFADVASLTTTAGQVLAPNTLLDAALYPIGAVGTVRLTSITLAAGVITLVIGDDLTANLCSGSFDALDPPSVIPVADGYGRPAGLLVSTAARLLGLNTWPAGTHTFARGTADFVGGVVIPTPEIGLRGILTEAGELLTGEIWIVGDNGVVVRQNGAGIIRVDIVGDPLFARALCFPINQFVPPQFVLTINHCQPDQYGNYQLTVGSHLTATPVLRIYSNGNGLVIETVGQGN